MYERIKYDRKLYQAGRTKPFPMRDFKQRRPQAVEMKRLVTIIT